MMQKTYDPKSIETSWYQTWEEKGYFAPKEIDKQNDNAYCIMIPPPNVTGTLHMGHAFQDTIMDTLTRYHRMKGDNTLWQPGCDHAGIATQMVVERQLNAEGKTRHDLGREKFVERVWEWKNYSGGTITQQLRRLGSSLDWSRERFTMDDGLSDAVHKIFIQLYDQGLIYRGKRLVNWDPVLHTALSDIEVLSEEEEGKLWHFRYPLSDGSGHVVVATTRPETMLGDAAVAVHPEDPRYKSLIGKTIDLPLVGRQIPIIGDDYVDPEFGSGCVKITPAHDFNDYAMGERHDLPKYNIFTDSAAINDEAPEKYQDMDRYIARDAIIEDLDALGLVEKIEKHKLMAPRGDRSNAIVEPYLTDQWFVDLTNKTQANGQPGGQTVITDPAIEVVRNGQIKFVPENWSKTYYQWLENIQDWCISRQLWWGHRIPAWYDEDGNIYVAKTEDEVREKYKLAADLPLRQDEDVLDTWFSSALWPFSTLGWPEQTDALKTFYPTSVLVTGFDIIFFWVARMIMFGLVAMDGQVPFREIYMHGLVRDSSGQKMSKSKGNVLDPLDIIDGTDLESLVKKRTSNLMQSHLAGKIENATRKEFPEGIAPFGTDALRFTFCAMATTGRDINFDLKRVEGYRNFCNKIWNAARYVLMSTEEHQADIANESRELSLADRWIISELQNVKEQVATHLAQYRLDLAAQALYDFTWREYCDWYLEFSKPTLFDDTSAEQKRGTRHTLVSVLADILKLLHPMMPFITEELWQKVAPLAGQTDPSIMLAAYPQKDEKLIDNKAGDDIEWLKNFIMGVRRIRAEMDIAPGKKLPVLLKNGSSVDQQCAKEHDSYLRSLARIDSISWLEAGSEAPESATALIGNLEILIPLAGLIDKDAELIRLTKEMEKLAGEMKRLNGKLSNEKFVSRAPEAVVEKEKQKLAEAHSAHEKLTEQFNKISAM